MAPTITQGTIMRWLLFFVGLMPLLGHNQEFFLKANQAYKEGEYAKALELYTAISEPSSAVWYNRGVVLYNQQEYLKALSYFAKARQYSSYNSYEKINAAYHLTQATLNIPIQSVFLMKLYRKVEHTSLALSLLSLQLLTFLIFIVILLFVIFYTKKLKWYIVIILSAIMVCTIILMVVRERLRTRIPIIISAPTATLYIGPDKQFSTVGTLRQGEELYLVETRDQWYKVKNSSVSGWIQTDKVEKL